MTIWFTWGLTAVTAWHNDGGKKGNITKWRVGKIFYWSNKWLIKNKKKSINIVQQSNTDPSHLVCWQADSESEAREKESEREKTPFCTSYNNYVQYNSIQPSHHFYNLTLAETLPYSTAIIQFAQYSLVRWLPKSLNHPTNPNTATQQPRHLEKHFKSNKRRKGAARKHLKQ